MADIIVEIVLWLILLIGCLWGIKTGFVRTVAKPAKFIMALFLAISLSSVFGSVFIKPMIQEPIITKLTEFFTEKIGEGVAAAQELPTLVKFAASLAGVDLEAISSAEAQANMVTAIITAVTDPVLDLISSVIAFFVLYILLKLAMNLVFAIIDAVVDNGVLGVVNRALGCLVMTFMAFTVAWGLCAISDLILNIPVVNEQEWVQDFSGGMLYTFLKGLSPIDLLLGLLLSF